MVVKLVYYVGLGLLNCPPRTRLVPTAPSWRTLGPEVGSLSQYVAISKTIP
jgi:hypothetical protein